MAEERRVKVVTDSGGNLAAEMVKGLGIDVVPLTVSFPDGTSYTEGVDTTAGEFQEKMLSCLGLPKTSQPSPKAYMDAFERNLESGHDVLCITLSSALSGSFQSALLAADQVARGARQGSLEVLDSLTASLAQGVLAMGAAELAATGISLPELISRVKGYQQELNTFFTLQTLDNIVQGGRLSPIKARIASVLNINPIFRGNDQGEIEMFEKARGRKRALSRLVELVGEFGIRIHEKVVGISHVACLAEATDLAEEIRKRYRPRQVIVELMSATTATYAGKGGIIVGF